MKETPKYSIKSCIILFFIFAFIGWLYECTYRLMHSGTLVNRGFFLGPYLPIYGAGGLCIIIFLQRFYNKKVLSFILIIFICCIIEYLTSYVLELIYHKLWWNYSFFKLNLNGRICAEAALLFGFAGYIVNYHFAPFINKLIIRIPNKIQLFICIILIIIITLDFITSIFAPHSGISTTISNVSCYPYL